MKLTLHRIKVICALSEDPSRRRYGMELSRDLGMGSGALYPVLTQLIEEGLVSVQVEETVPPDRPRRKYYTLTPDGAQYAAVVRREVMLLLGGE